MAQKRHPLAQERHLSGSKTPPVKNKNCNKNSGKRYTGNRGGEAPTPQTACPYRASTSKGYRNLIAGLAGLGLSGVTEERVEAALQKLYPHGMDGVDEPTQLRAVFVHLMRQDRGDNVRR